MISYYKFVLISCLVVFVSFSKCYAQTGCTFSYKTDLADKEPILLTNSKFGHELLIPKTPEISLKSKEEITLACPGVTNKLNEVNKEVATFKCEQGNKVSVNGKQFELKNLGCDKRSTGQTFDTYEPCGKRGTKKIIGHKIQDKWYSVFFVCYDQKQGNTLFSKHLLQGASIHDDKQEKIDSNFKISGLEFRTKPDQIITHTNLEKIFTNLLGTKKIAGQYINAKSTLVKTQLSPRTDFTYKTSQYVPHYYINTVPQWQQINAGNWKTLKENIRTTASNTNENFKIITGTHDVLTLKNHENFETKLYLDKLNTLPIPKYLYKIVYSNKKAIVFVLLNNPFVKTLETTDYLCANICDNNGWGNDLWKDASKGFVYCCEVKQFMEKVKDVPNIGEVSGILQGNTVNKKTATQNRADCLLDYKSSFPDKEPILLKKSGQNYELFSPDNQGVSLRSGEEITLFCPGTSNKISKLNKNIATLKCNSGNMLKAESKSVLFKDLGCNNKVNTDHKLTKEECLGKGLIKEIGHKIDDKNFITLVKVCYDHKEGIPLYSEHVLHGAAIKSANQLEKIIDYKVAGLEFRVNAEEDYKNVNQKTLFENLLGSKDLALKYINANSYLARAHLSPSADFIYSSSKYASYFYINSVPQWQSINNGNWKSLENAIRNTGSLTKQTYDIITGGHGVLSLKNTTGNDVEIYLDVLKTLPVPQFIYKVVYSAETKKGIAFVSLNNPFIESVKPNAYICPNICKNYGWNNADWEKKEKGVVYCCEIKELLKVVPNLPDLGVLRGVLEGKK